MEWEIWRVVTSEVTRGQSYHEICEHWTIDDLDHANCVIDAFELAQLKQQAASEAQRAKR